MTVHLGLRVSPSGNDLLLTEVFPNGDRSGGDAMLTALGSQMPRHLISDAHEWINEIPTVPIYHLAKPQPRERAWHN